MKPVDWDDSQDRDAYLDSLTAWENARDALVGQQDAAAAQLVAAQSRLDTVGNWLARLQGAAAAAAARADQLAANTAMVAAIAAELPGVEDRITDHQDARDVGTARLLGGPGTDTPLVLLPVRLQTRWLDGTLHVRIYPDDVAVDAHDPALTADETTWAEHYWQVRSGTVAADPEEAWQQLVRRYGPTRAAWLVVATRPGAPVPAPRDGPWPRPPRVRLLPDRFAVVALSGGVPLNVAAVGTPARYATWGEPVTEPLALPGAGDDPSAVTWWTDLAAARAAGMAVAIPVPAGAPPIDTLVAVGVRGDRPGSPAAGELPALLAAQSVSAGVELLAPGTVTNNSGDLRSTHSPSAREAAARAVRDGLVAPPPPLTGGAGGARLARLIGVPEAIVGVLQGASTDAVSTVDAARLVVGFGVRGALRGRLGPAADAVWSLLWPGGPAPAVRVGRQPYGVVPVSAPGRWRARAGEAGAALVEPLAAWAAATGPVVRTDPGAPPPAGPAARHITLDDDTELASLLLESASTLTWVDGSGAAADGVDGLVGPDSGEGAPASALARIAATAVADLPGLPVPVRAGSLLARIAVAAKASAPAGHTADLNAALGTLGSAGRGELALVVAEFLDAASHRFDAWVTAVAGERLAAQRAAAPTDVAVGAFGWLTDVAPRVLPRSFGHVHAPSVGQAATAAVLRSAYLGERRRAWTGLVDSAAAAHAAAQAALDGLPANASPTQRQALLDQRAAAAGQLSQARAGRDQLAPLDPTVERGLPLAVDLSSSRVRSALWVLSAVRSGQPLGAVLGHQFERDFATAGLSQYLSAFRKLTRFQTGTALEQVEQTLAARKADLLAARGDLAARRQIADDLAGALGLAQADEQVAAARVAAATVADEPYRQLAAQRVEVLRSIGQLTDQLDAIDASRPTPAQHPFHVQLP